MVEALDENDRVTALLAPLKADKAAWEATFTEEEIAKGSVFEESLRTDSDALALFMSEIDAAFVGSD